MFSIRPDPENEKTLRALQSIEENLQEKGVREGLRHAGTPIASAMKTTAPDDPSTRGNRLRERIIIEEATSGTRVRTGAGGRFVDLAPGQVGIVVGPNLKKSGIDVSYIAWMVEGGTKPHQIRPRRRNAHGALWIKYHFFRGVVRHPGARANPFMSRSLDIGGPLMEDGFYRGLAGWLDHNGR